MKVSRTTTTAAAILSSLLCLSTTSASQLMQGSGPGLAASPSAPAPQMGLPQPQIPLTSSIPQGQPTNGVMQLGLLQALELGLRNNLGIITSGYTTESARAARLRSLADLLPSITTLTTWTSEQVNLAAFGLSVPGIPNIVGPFHVFDARAYGA